MPRDATLKLVYARAVEEAQKGEDRDFIAYMTNSWLRTATEIRTQPEITANFVRP